jgi:hypothetical protein
MTGSLIVSQNDTTWDYKTINLKRYNVLSSLSKILTGTYCMLRRVNFFEVLTVILQVIQIIKHA